MEISSSALPGPPKDAPERPPSAECSRCGEQAGMSPFGSYGCERCGWLFYIINGRVVHSGWRGVDQEDSCKLCHERCCWTTQTLLLGPGRPEFHYVRCKACRRWYPGHAWAYEDTCRRLKICARCCEPLSASGLLGNLRGACERCRLVFHGDGSIYVSLVDDPCWRCASHAGWKVLQHATRSDLDRVSPLEHTRACRHCGATSPLDAVLTERFGVVPPPPPIEPCERCGALRYYEPPGVDTLEAAVTCRSCCLVERAGSFSIDDGTRCGGQTECACSPWQLVVRTYKGKRRFFRYCVFCGYVCAKDAEMLASQDVPAHVYRGGRCAHCHATFVPGQGHGCPGTQHSCCASCAEEPCPTSVSATPKQARPRSAVAAMVVATPQRREEQKELASELQQSLREVEDQRLAFEREQQRTREELDRLREQTREAQQQANLEKIRAQQHAAEVEAHRKRAEDAIIEAQRLASQTVKVEAERRQAMERRLKELEAQQQAERRQQQADQQQSEERRECVICLDAPRDTVLLECGHVATCGRCAAVLVGNACPICRASVRAISRIFVA
jgi:hypothetical protein